MTPIRLAVYSLKRRLARVRPLANGTEVGLLARVSTFLSLAIPSYNNPPLLNPVDSKVDRKWAS